MDKFEQRFRVTGKTTQKLRGLLRQAPEFLLEQIWEQVVSKQKKELDNNDGTEIGRGEKEEILYREIQENFKRQLLYLDEDQIKLLFRVMNRRRIGLVDTLGNIHEFCCQGWVFCFVNDGSSNYIMADEIKSILLKVKEPEFKNKMAFNHYVRGIVNGCLELYGVCRQEEMVNIHRHIAKEEVNTEEFVKKLGDMLPRMEEQGLLWRDDGYIVNEYLKTRKQYQELLAAQGRCDYFMPERDTFLTYARQNGVEKTAEYKAVRRYLVRIQKSVRLADCILEELCEYITREDWGLAQVKCSLSEWDVTFDNLKTAGKLTKALREWIDSVRRWSERGYSPRERGKHKEKRPFLETEIIKFPQAASAKVYPNDPCPCGSGKKYKQCCGRKQ